MKTKIRIKSDANDFTIEYHQLDKTFTINNFKLDRYDMKLFVDLLGQWVPEEKDPYYLFTTAVEALYSNEEEFFEVFADFVTFDSKEKNFWRDTVIYNVLCSRTLSTN
jgi:hypothetical protein